MTDSPATDRRLAALSKGACGVVHGVRHHGATFSPLERRLAELGFVGGERFEVLAEAWPSRDPMVVRIGSTTLALRRREAASIAVELDPPSRPAGNVAVRNA